jgi:hypothetical protein
LRPLAPPAGVLHSGRAADFTPRRIDRFPNALNPNPPRMAHITAARRSHGYAMTIERTGRLTDEQKTYIVERLASYDDPAEIAFGLKTQFGVDITPRAVAHYQPGMVRGKKLSEPLQALFWQARKTFVLTHDEIWAMDLLMRTSLRERALLEAWAAHQCGIANDILDAIAQECRAYEREFGHQPRGPNPIKFH